MAWFRHEFCRRWVLGLVVAGVLSCSTPTGPVRAPTSVADLPQKVRRLVEQFGNDPVLFKDPFLSTFWGAVVDFRYLMNSKKTALDAVWVPSEHFAKKKVKAYLHTQKTQSPLVVLLPGLAGEPKDAFNQRVAHWFGSRGYHIIVVPSPWSEEFRAWNPAFAPGDIEAEAQAMYQIVREALKKFDPNQVESVDLFGSSYGALMAPLMKVLDLKHQQPIFDRAVTLNGPPISMAKSVEFIDTWIDEVMIQKKCSKAVMNPLFIKNVVFAKNEEDLNKLAVNCSKHVMVKIGFYKVLRDRLSSYYKHHPEKFPSHLHSKSTIQTWLKKIRYQKYFETFAPSVPSFNSHDQKLSLFYWIEEARKLGFEDFNMISARDDILNDPDDWKSYDPDFVRRTVVMLPWGGHVGFKSTKWYQDFLDAHFGNRKKGIPFEEPESIDLEGTPELDYWIEQAGRSSH